MAKINRLDVRAVRTEKAVRKAFFALTETKDISEISVKEITDVAKINRTTFYLHYKSVEDVYVDIINGQTEECRDIILRNREDLADFNFEKCAEEFIEFFDKNYGGNSRVLHTNFTTCLKRKIRSIANEIFLDLYKNTNMRDKYILVSDEVLIAIVNGFIAIISDWIASDRTVHFHKVCREYRDIILNGISKW